MEGSQEVWGEPVERCIHCFRDFPISVLVGHSAKCQGDLSGSRKRLQGFTPSVHDVRNSFTVQRYILQVASLVWGEPEHFLQQN